MPGEPAGENQTSKAPLSQLALRFNIDVFVIGRGANTPELAFSYTEGRIQPFIIPVR